MRLLHTSDWHLGRNVLGISLLEDQRAFCEHLIELTHDFRPDLVVILGDIFERSIPSEEALELLDHVLQRLLLECKVRVLLAPGLQDGIQRLSFGSWLYERKQLHMVTQLEQALSPIMLEDADGPVQIHAIPHLRLQEVDQHFRGQSIHSHAQAGNAILEHLTRFRRLRRKAVRGVVAGYLWVEGGELCGEERPLEGDSESAVALASFEGIHYSALGYLHRPQVLGEGRFCYSGSPVPFQFEAQPTARGVVKVEMDAQGEVHSELVPFPAHRHFYRFQGQLERLLHGPSRKLDPSDLVVLELSQDSALLSADMVQRLRQNYPNLWRIERRDLQARPLEQGGQDPLESFQTFFGQVTGESVDSEDMELLQDLFLELEP